MNRLLELVSGHDASFPLDRAALELATIEFPGLTAEPFVAMLDSHAEELSRRLDSSSTGAEYVQRANQYLFEELGFTGNEQDYYSPRNSCLNEVLTTRTGIPITLSIVYMEIGRRLGKPIYGIGLPGHFLVRYDDGFYCTYIDPFNGGKLLGPGQCIAVARKASGLELKADPRLLDPIDKGQIVLRMIHNLRRAYLARGSVNKAIEVMDLLIRINPRAADEYRNRGMLHAQGQNMTAARDDFERYLQLAPNAEDKQQVQEQLQSVRRWLASLN